jgi:hypothetical protein
MIPIFIAASAAIKLQHPRLDKKVHITTLTSSGLVILIALGYKLTKWGILSYTFLNTIPHSLRFWVWICLISWMFFDWVRGVLQTQSEPRWIDISISIMIIALISSIIIISFLPL